MRRMGLKMGAACLLMPGAPLTPSDGAISKGKDGTVFLTQNTKDKADIPC